MGPSEHTVELFGIPRQRAGVAETMLAAADVAELLTEMETRFPRLGSSRSAMAAGYADSSRRAAGQAVKFAKSSWSA
jgi:hypothetical protein